MKKKFTKLAASIGIALTQSSNADVDIENGYSDTNSDVQLYKLPLNMETPIFLAAHGSHRSHGSHGSHSSHRSGQPKPRPTPDPPIIFPPLPTTTYTDCPDSILPYKKHVVRKVQYLMIEYNYLENSDVNVFGIMGYNSRISLKNLKKQNNLPTKPGVMLDRVTLERMQILCD